MNHWNSEKSKALQVVRRTFDKGYPQVTFEADQLRAGVLSYRLETDNHTASGQLVVIDWQTGITATVIYAFVLPELNITAKEVN